MTYLLSVIAIIIAYLSGSIPVGYIVARLYGVNVTASGSGRIGGTNVLRSVGVLAAGLTVLGDVLKSLVPIYLLMAVGIDPLTVALAAAAAVIGHNHSIFLGFRGGVGAGTALGALAAISFIAALIVGVCALVALALSRYASVLSTTTAILTPIVLTVMVLFGLLPASYIVFGVIILGVMFYALRPNFARLRAGTERRIGQRAENIAASSSQR
ncbi:MAG: glycerol-3-phosphate acyltransferase [Anaerolineae bacterium]